MVTLEITYQGERFTVARRPELAIAGVIPWCVAVDAGWYMVGADAAEAADDARRFFTARLKFAGRDRRGPAWVASHQYPLMLSIHSRAVRAWPVRTDQRYHGIEWMFDDGSRHGEGGAAHPSDTIASVRLLAESWASPQS